MSAFEKQQYTRFEVEPYTPNIGATIRGIDLAAASDPILREELRRALWEFQVLFLPKQNLTQNQQIDAARIFGDPDKAKAYFPRAEGRPQIELIEAAPHGYRHDTNQWHADISFSTNPPTGVVLYAHEIPPLGGDTVWSSATKVYEALTFPLASFLERLEAFHSLEHSGWPRFFLSQADGEARYRAARAEHLPVAHPVIRTHPITGKKLVYVNPNFVSHIKGVSRQESDRILGLLFDLFDRPEYQARLRWEKHTVAIWDNRATVHYAVADYDPQYHRLLHRVTFGEDQAFDDARRPVLARTGTSAA